MTLPPHATPVIDGTPYAVERRVFGGIPCLVERPLTDVRALALVYHGVSASKEGNLGLFTPLVRAGFAVVLPDAVGHGERAEASLNSTTLGYRNFLRTCAAKTALEAPDLIGALHAEFGPQPTGAIGISMGGFAAHYLALREKRLGSAVVISSGGVWSESEVSVPLARDFIEAYRPSVHADLAPPTRLLVLHGEDDEVFALPDYEVTVRAYRSAYAHANCPERFESRLYPNVGHYTTGEMLGEAVAWLRAEVLSSES